MPDPDAEIPGITTGLILGGRTPGNKGWRDGIQRIRGSLDAYRDKYVSSLNLTIVFIVEGNLSAPDFEGARTGRLFKAQNTLALQVAVGGQASEMQSVADLFPLSLMDQALDEAQKWIARRRREDSLVPYRELFSIVRADVLSLPTGGY